MYGGLSPIQYFKTPPKLTGKCSTDTKHGTSEDKISPSIQNSEMKSTNEKEEENADGEESVASICDCLFTNEGENKFPSMQADQLIAFENHLHDDICMT